MKIKVALFSLVALAFSCSMTNQRWPLSEVYVFNQEHNEVIINRVQEYGDGTPNGCIVPGMIRLDINQYSSDKIIGSLSTVRNFEGIPFCELKILKDNKSVIESSTDIDGNFVLPVKEGEQLVITGFGFETMTLEWDELLEIIMESE